MKTWKKVLIGLVILGVVGLGLFTYGIVKLSTNIMEKMEPDMKQYVVMTTEQQDKYVYEHMEEWVVTLKKFDGESDGSELDLIKTDPAVRQAGIDFGRSICATVIVDTDSIASVLTPEEKARYQKEADESDARGDKFSKEMERAVKAMTEKK